MTTHQSVPTLVSYRFYKINDFIILLHRVLCEKCLLVIPQEGEQLVYCFTSEPVKITDISKYFRNSNRLLKIASLT